MTTRKPSAKTKFKRIAYGVGAAALLALAARFGLVLDERWTDTPIPMGVIEGTASNLNSRLDAVEERLNPVGEHDHAYPEGWSAPVQMDGNYVIPQFYQYRTCRLCGQAEVRFAK